MFKTSSLLLLTLVLNIQLCSSAPIPANIVQSSALAEEPGQEELAPITDNHSHFIEEKEYVQEKLIPVVAGEAGPSPEQTAEEDIPVTAKDEPEPVFIKDRDDDDALYQELAPQETLAAAPQESSEKESFPEEAAFANASPNKTTQELAPAVAVGSESPEQHYAEDPALEAHIPVIPLEGSEDEAQEENLEEETAVAGESAVENVSPEQHGLEEPAPAAPIPIIQVGASGDEAAEKTAPAPEEPAVVVVPMEPAEPQPDQEEQKETVSIVLEENADVDPAANEELLPSTLEEEESVALFPVELETEEQGQVESIAEETAPEESAAEEPIIVPMEPAEPEPYREEQEETALIISSETKEEEAPEEHAKEDEAQVVLEENADVDPATNEEPLASILEEEESVALFPVELETEEDGQVEPAAQEESEQDTEGPGIIVPLDPAEEEPQLEEQVKEESITIVSPEEPDEEAAVSVSSTPEEEESVVLVHAELDTEEEGQVEAEGTVPASEKPAVIVLVGLTSEEPAPEDPILVIPLEDLEEDAPEDNTKEVVESDPFPKEDNTAVRENEADDTDAEIHVTSVTIQTTETVLDPGEEVPAATIEVHIATEILTEAAVEPVTAPEPGVTDAEAEIVPAPTEGGNGTSEAVITLIEDEPIALVNRGTVLGAAFFTLMSFITIGFLWSTVSKKLH